MIEMTKRILLVCGGGASSGFLAANIRKYAKKQGADMQIEARSESELSNYINDIDVLLVGPHLAYMEDEIKSMTDPKGIPMALIDEDDYGMMNGAAVYDQIVTMLGDD
jgi:PTS system cellobiose-specific IIB component